MPFILTLGTVLCGLSAGPTSPVETRSVDVQMRNVMYHFTDNIAVRIYSLNGQLVPINTELPVFDDQNSFKIQIASAVLAITPESLANVLNSYVFARRDAPVKDVSIRIDSSGRLKVKGKLHGKGDIPFETEGVLTSTSEGKIRLHAQKIKTLHLPVKGLMDILGIDLADLIKTGKVRGLTVDKDDLVLDPDSLLPPPHISGTVTDVKARFGQIVQVFGNPKESQNWQISAANYMAYRKNQLRFGKLTMSDTDLVLIDMDPKDPFDFYLDHYKEQLVAGYTKETSAFGLRVYMRDYNKLRGATSNGTAHR
ncbi:MAG TPA: hypothetical protein VG498_00830 [Terriglobales bacterium]|nr:hypothetical protein [Terriglobales bacterium]